jgi:hypothetical protein
MDTALGQVIFLVITHVGVFAPFFEVLEENSMKR